MVTVGRNAAVARLGVRTFTGYSAWILWLGVHLAKLIGFRNRLLVLISWAWDYFFYERAVRLVLCKRLEHTSQWEQCDLGRVTALGMSGGERDDA